jgi:hypothetical protein
MGCDYMGCHNCRKAFDWNYADTCKRCNEENNFICPHCYRCVECNKTENEEISDSEMTERENQIINTLKKNSIKKDMSDEELLEAKNEQIKLEEIPAEEAYKYGICDECKKIIPTTMGRCINKSLLWKTLSTSCIIYECDNCYQDRITKLNKKNGKIQLEMMKMYLNPKLAHFLDPNHKFN